MELNAVISTIASITTSLTRDKIQRQKSVTSLLKRFNLDPDHPSTDFTSVYTYTLVEYGVGKPKPLLELFRQQEIQQAFRNGFDDNNPSRILNEVDKYLNEYALGDDIKALGLNIKREVAAFAAVFIEVANRTRTPAEVLRDLVIKDLRQTMIHLTEKLDRLPTNESIRTEIARLLAAQSDLELPEVSSPQENKLKAIALAQQMRGWFETLDYDFEKDEVWSDKYFEWIIRVPVRRRGYDRVLVRGIEGEAELGDVRALRQSVEAKNTDEGWLVTARRISPKAREEVEKKENRHLACYTFDELIDEEVDFSGYLDWLENEIKRREIDTKYVPLACIKEEFDRDTKSRLGRSRYDNIDSYINLWLADPAKEHISILGEFGTGKTWFAFHYAWQIMQQYRDAKTQGLERPRLPLVIPLRDYAKALTIESLFSEFFFRQHEIRTKYSVFEHLNRMGKLLLIFDGFDEMADRIDRQKMINNFWELAKVVVPGSKVILTCRTEHFPEAKEGRAVLRAELQAPPTGKLIGETPQFEVLELETFNDEQIRKVLSFKAETATVDLVMGNQQLLDLARRPVMSELILEALPDIEAGKPVDMSRVYLYAVRQKMERDIKQERTFTSLADKLYFLCELSWEMLSTNEMSLNYRLFPDRVRRLFGDVVQQKDLDYWRYDLQSQTILIRNADGDYTPAHRSLVEFFVAYKLAAGLGILADDFIELAQQQSYVEVNAKPQNYTWSSYFRRQMDEAGNIIIPIPPLKAFTPETLIQLRNTFGKAPLTKAVIDLLLPMLAKGEIVESALLKILEQTKGKTRGEVEYIGGNAATLILKVNKKALEGKDLERAVIIGGNFTNASLRDTKFAQADLTDCVFTKVLASVRTIAFSLDGNLLATGDYDGVIRLWEVANGRELLVCKGHIGRINSVSFSPNGAILASGSDDQTVRLWDIETGECCHTLEGHTLLVRSVAFSTDGKTLASGSEDKTVRLWDIETGECCHTLERHTLLVRSVAFSTDGKTLASGSEDKTVRIWNIKTGQCLHTLKEHNEQVNSVAFSPDDAMLASGSDDKTVRLWDIKTGQCCRTLEEYTKWVSSVAFSPDGRTLAIGSGDYKVWLWDISTGKSRNPLEGHTSWVNSVAFSPDGAILASGSGDQTVRLWDINTGICFNTLQGHISWGVNSVVFSPDGAILASGSGDKIVRLWDINTGEYRTFEGHTSRVNSVAFSPNGAILASGSDDQTVRLWDINTGEYRILKGHSSWVSSVVFSPDGEKLVSGSGDKTVRLWDIKTGECRILKGHSSWVSSVALSPDGTMLTISSGNSTVLLCNINTVDLSIIEERPLEGHTLSVRSVAFSRDGAILASGSDDQTVRLWNINNNTHSNSICFQHTSRVNSVAFSPDGAMLASGSGDYKLWLWNVNREKPLHTLQEHTGRVNAVAFSPDGCMLATGSEDGTIKLWKTQTGECVKKLRIPGLYEGMNITGVIGLTAAEKVTLQALGAKAGV
ncbi:NACHT domain-containing protein [Scytonema sp. UIC 10036]|uniref:WD40 domain-containing protein n=1 Tax=Scytonema sp. UIC 10036 TaxID=2304196 RepID=UPI0012DA292E|nr:NACHT domain-containing protein [Scytonema sp. UIC 10036]MUG98832.1 NACHT domain-containing protein [Scytonema sp. UIC 10036]